MAKETCKEEKILSLSVYGLPAQRKIIDGYFAKNRGVIKHRKILDWVLAGIEAEKISGKVS